MWHAAFYFSEALFKGESLVHQLSISVTHGTASTEHLYSGSLGVSDFLHKSAFVSTKIKKCLGFTFTTQRVLIQKQDLSNSKCTSTSTSSSFQ